MALKLLDHENNLSRVEGIEAGCGLVVQDDLGIHDDASGDSHSALHATAHLRGEKVFIASQADAFEGGEDFFPDGGLSHVRVFAERVGKVLEDGETIEESAVLEDIGDAFPDGEEVIFIELQDVIVMEKDGAAIWAIEANEGAEEHAFAGAAAAHEGEDFAFVHGKVDLAVDDFVAESLLNPLNFDDLFHSRLEFEPAFKNPKKLGQYKVEDGD